MPTFTLFLKFLICAFVLVVGFTYPVLAQDKTHNFVLTRTYKVPLKDAAVPVSVGEATLSLGYFDGLGRLQQTVNVQAGKDKKDIVAPVEYDALGRTSKTYLPANTAVQNGNFQPTAATLALNFYNDATRFADPTSRVYTESLYEAAPLNRPVGQIAAGTSQPTTVVYGINDGSVRKYQAGATLTDITQNGNYGLNQLTITQTIDEEGKQTADYTDKDGRLILRRAGSGQVATSTYYVYDDLNQLRAVIQPAVELLPAPSSAAIASYAFLYLYDGRGRLVQKKVPGAGATLLEYNTRDLLIKTTDANGNVVNTIYDALNRPIQTTRGDGQPLSYTYYDDYESIMPDGTRLFDGLGFTSSTAADTYAWTTTDDFVPATMRTAARKGQLTGQCVRLLNADGTLSNLYNCQVNYYDNRYRLVQTVRRLSLNGSNGIERISYKRDFAGKVLSQKTTQSWSGQSYTLEKLMTYDHAERLTSTRYITSGTDAVFAGKDKYLNALVYNEIGQLADKYLNATNSSGAGAMEHLTYKNNVRGWLREHKGIQNASRPYLLTLGYQNNGNIATQNWQYRSMTQAKTYLLGYDALNRLSYGNLGGVGGLSEALTYDLNGNIQTLSRRDANNNLIDALSYSYWPDNRLRAVTDGATTTGGFNDYPGTDDYSYDANGNILTDNNKGIFTNISYNYLNLPQKLTLNGKTLSYLYDAAGTKHSFTNNGVITNYEGIFEYNGGLSPIRVQTDEGQLVKDGTVWKWQYYLKDHLGNVRVVLDETGDVVQETEYYPFGLAVPKTPGDIAASRLKNKYLYLNRELQEETGWLDLHARFYDPVIGRFLTIDPLTESQEHLSPYHYGYDNPIRYSDPDGKCPLCPVLPWAPAIAATVVEGLAILGEAVVATGTLLGADKLITSAPPGSISPYMSPALGAAMSLKQPGERLLQSSSNSGDGSSGSKSQQDGSSASATGGAGGGKNGGSFGAGKDTFGNGSSNSSLRNAKEQNGIPRSQQPDKTIKPNTPEGQKTGLDNRNVKQHEYTNSKGEKVIIRQDKPAQYNQGGRGDQGSHHNAGKASDNNLKQHHYDKKPE